MGFWNVFHVGFPTEAGNPFRALVLFVPYGEGGGVARPGAGQAEPAPIAASGAAEAPKSRVDEVHREATPKAPLTLEGRPRTPAPPPPPDSPSPNTLHRSTRTAAPHNHITTLPQHRSTARRHDDI